MNPQLPKISFPSVRKILIFVFAGALLFSSGYVFGVNGFNVNFNKFPKAIISKEVPPNHQDVNFSLFWKVWDDLEASYYDKTKIVPSQLVYGAISGMVAAVGDPYTVFLPPTENKVVQEDLNGSFEGVGIQIGYKGTQLAVIAPLPDSPAEEAGVKAGDFIIRIKDDAKKIDTGTVGMNLPEAVKAIRGSRGTKVELTLLRDGATEPIVVEMTRARLDVPSVIATFDEKDKNIAHIKLLKFGAETDAEWAKAVKTISQNKDLKGVILDLRNNPGGYLQGAVDIASEFLNKNSLVVVEDRGTEVKKEFRTNRQGSFTGTPVVVLINGGSASASEILAGALRDERGVKLVGEKSFGKGTIQEPQELEGGSGLHITIARWLTPKGTWVNEKSLEPDVKIEDDPKTSQDEQLLEAIKLLQ